jgi:hypothetical protein
MLISSYAPIVRSTRIVACVVAKWLDRRRQQLHSSHQWLFNSQLQLDNSKRANLSQCIVQNTMRRRNARRQNREESSAPHAEK